MPLGGALQLRQGLVSLAQPEVRQREYVGVHEHGLRQTQISIEDATGFVDDSPPITPQRLRIHLDGWSACRTSA